MKTKNIQTQTTVAYVPFSPCDAKTIAFLLYFTGAYPKPHSKTRH
jgi:hypothetical protein